jgi:hypothetical protein
MPKAKFTIWNPYLAYIVAALTPPWTILIKQRNSRFSFIWRGRAREEKYTGKESSRSRGVKSGTPNIKNVRGGRVVAAVGPKADIFHAVFDGRRDGFVKAIEDEIVLLFQIFQIFPKHQNGISIFSKNELHVARATFVVFEISMCFTLVNSWSIYQIDPWKNFLVPFRKSAIMYFTLGTIV